MEPTPRAGLMLSMGAADLFMRPVVDPNHEDSLCGLKIIP